MELTPYGQSVMVVFGPTHAGFVGGVAANVSPATAQFTLHATAVIVSGGFPASKTGEGSTPPAGVVPLNASVAGSMAYCHVALPATLNCRSAARGSVASLRSTVCVRGMSYA